MPRYHPHGRARAARRRGARHRPRDEAPRRRPRLPRHHAPRPRRSCETRFPTIYAALPALRHRHDRASRSRSCRPRTTCAAACGPTSTARTDAAGPATRSGEAACTGLHGANRLASNSLLEALVFAHHAAAERPAAAGRGAPPAPRAEPGTRGTRAAARRAVVVDHNWDEVRRADVGLRRHRAHRQAAGVARSAALRACCARRSSAYYWRLRARRPTCSSCATSRSSASLIVDCARRRRESRGLHYNLDHPRRGRRSTGVRCCAAVVPLTRAPWPRRGAARARRPLARRAYSRGPMSTDDYERSGTRWTRIREREPALPRARPTASWWRRSARPCRRCRPSGSPTAPSAPPERAASCCAASCGWRGGSSARWRRRCSASGA